MADDWQKDLCLNASHDWLVSELLSQIVEDLPNVQSFEPRSKSAFFFKSLLSRRRSFPAVLGLTRAVI